MKSLLMLSSFLLFCSPSLGVGEAENIVFTTGKGEKYFLHPYKKSMEHRAFLKKLMEKKGVYESLRDGKPWESSLIDSKNQLYDTQNKRALVVLSAPSQYTPETFAVCWIVKNAQGEKIGRGGFQQEDSIQPDATEVYLALLPEHQRKGIGSAFVRTCTDWFRKRISSDVVLRGLAIPTNIASQKMLLQNGYEKQVDENGKAIKTKAWEMVYEVFENKPTQEEGCREKL